jgi:hypothetical protein
MDRKCHGREKPYQPSPKQILRACETIRATWSERELRKRAGVDGRKPWTPPQVPVNEEQAVVPAEEYWD